MRRPSQEPIAVNGIHLVRHGDYVIVKAEIDGRWVEVIREHYDGSFSHIIEPLGMRRKVHEQEMEDERQRRDDAR